MFRFGHRRGKGKFLDVFGKETGTVKGKRVATIERVASKLALTESFEGFQDETGRAILGRPTAVVLFGELQARARQDRAGSARRTGALHGKLDRSARPCGTPSIRPRDDRSNAGRPNGLCP